MASAFFDQHYMRSAISLARRGIGLTGENPSVGCVIVRDGVVISRARTADGGRPHAETCAIADAGDFAHGATMYVTLEPCTHHGQTPPCVDTIIQSGVRRVVIGAIDIDTRVSGRAQSVLQEAGIVVQYGVCEAECRALTRGFFKRVKDNRPFVTLKMACSLDGNIALESGESKWITGEIARRHVHLSRARHNAILVGSETVLSDDPDLTVRVDGVTQNPIRVVLDTQGRLSQDCTLVKTLHKAPLLVLTASGDHALRNTGADIVICDPHNIKNVMGVLSQRGINSVFVEGGAKVHSAFLRAGLCDSLMIYRAPKVLGIKTRPMFGDLTVSQMCDAYCMERIVAQRIGKDMLEIYEPSSVQKEEAGCLQV